MAQPFKRGHFAEKSGQTFPRGKNRREPQYLAAFGNLRQLLETSSNLLSSITGTKSSYWWGYDKNTGDFWVCNANAKLNWAWIENPLLDERIHRVKRLSELEEDEKKQEVSRSGTGKNAQKNEKSAGLEYPAEFRAAVREDILKRIKNENGFAELLDSIQKELGDDDLLRQSAYEGYAKKPEFKKYLEKK